MIKETKPWTLNGDPSSVKEVAKYCGLAESTCWYHAQKNGTYEAVEIRQHKSTHKRKAKHEVGNSEYAALSDKPRYSVKTPSKWERENLTVRDHRWIPHDKTLCP